MHSTDSSRMLRASASTIALAIAAPLVILANTAHANPAGGQVGMGSATISSPSVHQTNVDQTSEGVVIDWSSFNVGAGQTTVFVQPNAQAIAVNRIGGGNASQILGTLDANGRLVLINGNGMMFGKNSRVNVGALVATSTDGSDQDILAGNFTKSGSQNASIVNRGRIETSKGGVVALVAPHVTNAGSVEATLGTVALGAANKFTVDFAGDGLVSFAAQGDVSGSATVANTGNLAGANVSLTARAAEGVATGVVSMNGTIAAHGAHQEGGTIVLDAGDNGHIVVSDAKLDASGANGGGNVTIGGWNQNSVTVNKTSVINASATRTGNGGTITVISSITKFAGRALANGGKQSGNGGSIETSGHSLDIGGAGVDASSLHGAMGSWTLDPDNLTINSVAAAAIHSSLNRHTNVVLQTTASGTTGPGVVTSGAGDIDINSRVEWWTDATLTIDAYHSIDIAAKTQANGAGTLNLSYNDEGTDGTLSFAVPGHIRFMHVVDGITQGHLAIDGQTYVLENSVGQLASGITNSPGGDFALANNYNATVDGAYAASPIATTFTGTFEGLGNSIVKLTISAVGADDAGLFAQVGEGGSPRDIRLKRVNVAGIAVGPSFVGALAAENYGTLDNDVVTGMLVGGYFATAGGLVGENFGSGTILNSQARDTVTTGYSSYTGGLVGYDEGTIKYSSALGEVLAGYLSDSGGLVGYDAGMIGNSYAKGAVSAGYSSDAGGLAGFESGTIANSYAMGSVTTGYTSDAGGLVGQNDGTVDGAFARGHVTSGYTSYVGGLVGENDWAIDNAYATGAVTAVGASDSGGLVGYDDGTIAYAYSTGAVTGGGTIGGLIGYDAAPSGSLTDTYWDVTSSGIRHTADGAGNITDDPGIAGITTAQFKAGLPAGFSSAIWGEATAINSGRPYLLAVPPPS